MSSAAAASAPAKKKFPPPRDGQQKRKAQSMRRRAGLLVDPARLRRVLSVRFGSKLNKKGAVIIAAYFQAKAMEIENLAAAVATGPKSDIIKPTTLSIVAHREPRLRTFLHNSGISCPPASAMKSDAGCIAALLNRRSVASKKRAEKKKAAAAVRASAEKDAEKDEEEEDA